MTNPAVINFANITHGPANVWFKEFGDAAVEPANPTVVPTGVQGVSGWQYIGGTDGGVAFATAASYTERRIDQVTYRVYSAVESEDASLALNMANMELENLRFAMNGGTVASSGTGATKMKTFTPRTNSVTTPPSYFALLARGLGENGQPVDVILRRVLNTEGTGWTFGKVDARIMAATFMAHMVSDSIAPYVINQLTPEP